MIEFLRSIAAHRLAWGLLAASALLLELCALFFQHVLGLHPCVMCIYERIALLGVLSAGLLGMVAPQRWYLRWSALLLWGYSAFRGLQLALQPHAITTRISALALDLGASLLISFLLLLELSKLLGLIAQRTLPNDTAVAALEGTHRSRAVQALRAAGFMFFLGYDMGISFIPLLAQQPYEPFLGLSREVVIGLPISAEMISAGVALLFSGGFSLRYGWQKVFAAGTLASALGLLLGSMASGLPLLILGRVATGFGFGLVLMAGQIGTLGKANAGAGLTSVFAGIFSGSICGSAAGAMLADHISFQAVLGAAACTILLALFTVMLGKESAEEAAQSAAQKATPAQGHMFSGCLQLLQDPRMHLVLWLVGIPAAMCLTGFLHYLLPLRLANAHVDQSDIGRIFMLYGLCFITAGPLLGRWIDHRKDKSLFLTLTGLLSGITLLVAAKGTGMAGAAAAVLPAVAAAEPVTAFDAALGAFLCKLLLFFGALLLFFGTCGGGGIAVFG